jgi:hypothetical protein
VNATSSTSGGNSDPLIVTNGNWSGSSQEWLIFVRRAPKDSTGIPSILLHSYTTLDGARLGGSEDLYIYKNGSTSVVDSGWVHIAVVYDKAAGTNGQVRFYANGVQSSARSGYESPRNTNLSNGIGTSLKTLIGNGNNGSYNTSSRYVDCYIQDFRLTAGALSDAEIAALAE